jgi:oligopeptide/dipeptide ABC transporter ATP-binding protein
MALSCNPEILIADEPTTALDVTVQAQILELIRKLQDSLGMGMIMITHDLGVIAEVSKRVAVMYASKVVEYSVSDEIYYNPKHPYTLGLLNSIPKLNIGAARLSTIEGNVPAATDYPVGCHFCTRCKYVDSPVYNAGSKCWTQEPPLVQVDGTSNMHTVACHYWKDIERKRKSEGEKTAAA